MKELVQNFPNQLKEAKSIADRAIINRSSSIQNIVISGLGGSGIGGSIVSELVASSCPLPIIVNKDYFIPEFVNQHTLFIVSSYSGNTEETLSALQFAIEKKAEIVCITSGGKVLELAKQHQFEFIEIPGGMPPRSCLGYSLVQLIKIIVAKGFAPQQLLSDINSSIHLLEENIESIKTEAMLIAKQLHNKIAILYTLGSCEGVAVRFRQQINENSKDLCWHHTFPEMNHNELVGWTQKNDALKVVTFHTSFDFERTKKRYQLCKPLFEKYSSGVIDIEAKGKNKLEQFIYLIHVGDWISCFIADIKNIDPVEVNVINMLKNELSKLD